MTDDTEPSRCALTSREFCAGCTRRENSEATVAARSKLTWRYEPHRGVLYVRGGHFAHDLQAVKCIFDIGLVPFLGVEAIAYVPQDVDVPTLLRGHVLSEWFIYGSFDRLWHFQIEALKESQADGSKSN
jgi:hypothetical protein